MRCGGGGGGSNCVGWGFGRHPFVRILYFPERNTETRDNILFCEGDFLTRLLPEL